MPLKSDPSMPQQHNDDLRRTTLPSHFGNGILKENAACNPHPPAKATDATEGGLDEADFAGAAAFTEVNLYRLRQEKLCLATRHLWSEV